MNSILFILALAAIAAVSAETNTHDERVAAFMAAKNSCPKWQRQFDSCSNNTVDAVVTSGPFFWTMSSMASPATALLSPAFATLSADVGMQLTLNGIMKAWPNEVAIIVEPFLEWYGFDLNKTRVQSDADPTVLVPEWCRRPFGAASLSNGGPASGHSMMAAGMIVSALVSLLCKKTSTNKRIISLVVFVLVAMWAARIPETRVVQGYHTEAQICVGFVVGLGFSVVLLLPRVAHQRAYLLFSCLGMISHHVHYVVDKNGRLFGDTPVQLSRLFMVLALFVPVLLWAINRLRKAKKD